MLDFIFRGVKAPLQDTEQTNYLAVDALRNLLVSIATKVSSWTDAPVQAYPPQAVVTRITTAATTILSPTGTSGWFRLNVQGGAMGLVTVYDNGAASGAVEYAETPAAKDRPFQDWTRFETGLTIVTAAATTLLAEVIND